MEDQYFPSAQSTHLLELSPSGSTPMGFSPSIDMSDDLPFNFGDRLSAPFMLEVQKKCDNAMSPLRPNFFGSQDSIDQDGIQVDIPLRKRALQRLSLASPVSSSAPSTAPSEADALDLNNGFDSELDATSSASPTNDDAFTWSAATQSFDSLSGAFGAMEKVPDLIHSRSDMTIQAAYARLDGHISGIGFDIKDRSAHASEFSFAEFIDENPQLNGIMEDALVHQTVDSTKALSLDSSAVSPATIPSILPADSLGETTFHVRANNAGATLTADLSPSMEVNVSHHQGLVMAPSYTTSPVNSSLMAAVVHSSPVSPEWTLQSSMNRAMMFSQSAPSHNNAHMAMYMAGLTGSPVPSSPCSARSSSPYPNSLHGGPLGGMFSSSPLLNSPSPGQFHVQHLQTLPQGVDGLSLIGPFAHFANPYAGLITKRSRGRRVPNKPEEINNLGKSGKVYTCKVPGCGKCFKRSEHLKRHVRSIHTDEKPFMCPFPTCHKRFSRHDNLNQHARVHSSANGTPLKASTASAAQSSQGSQIGSPLGSMPSGTMPLLVQSDLPHQMMMERPRLMNEKKRVTMAGQAVHQDASNHLAAAMPFVSAGNPQM